MPTLSRVAKGNIANAARQRGLASKQHLLGKYRDYIRRPDFATHMQYATKPQQAVVRMYLAQDVTFADMQEYFNQSSSELRKTFVRGMQTIIEAMMESKNAKA